MNKFEFSRADQILTDGVSHENAKFVGASQAVTVQTSGNLHQ